jgi:hypothetical protein
MSASGGRLLRFAAWGGGAAVLALVFMAYLDPHTMVDLSNRVWSCIG